MDTRHSPRASTGHHTFSECRARVREDEAGGEREGGSFQQLLGCLAGRIQLLHFFARQMSLNFTYSWDLESKTCVPGPPVKTWLLISRPETNMGGLNEALYDRTWPYIHTYFFFLQVALESKWGNVHMASPNFDLISSPILNPAWNWIRFDYGVLWHSNWNRFDWKEYRTRFDFWFRLGLLFAFTFEFDYDSLELENTVTPMPKGNHLRSNARLDLQ